MQTMRQRRVHPSLADAADSFSWARTLSNTAQPWTTPVVQTSHLRQRDCGAQAISTPGGSSMHLCDFTLEGQINSLESAAAGGIGADDKPAGGRLLRAGHRHEVAQGGAPHPQQQAQGAAAALPLRYALRPPCPAKPVVSFWFSTQSPERRARAPAFVHHRMLVLACPHAV